MPDTPHDKPAASLAEAISRVYADMARVKKSGFNKQQNYAFAQDGDIVDQVREALHRHGLAYSTRMHAPSDRWEVTSKGGGKGTGCTAHVTFTLIHPDTGQTMDCPWEGDATDFTDKALPKAITAAKKSWLIAMFLISTGDEEPDASGTEAAATGSPPATQAQVRRAFAMAGEYNVDQRHLRLSAHLMTRTADNPDGRSINALTSAEMDAVYTMLENWKDRPKDWDEKLGKMAARLDAKASPPAEPEPAPAEPEPAAGTDERVPAPSWTPPADVDQEDDIPF